MAYTTIEATASDLEVGMRVMRNGRAWYVAMVRGNASGDIDVAFQPSMWRDNQEHQTYAADDPVELITGGLPEKPTWSEGRTLRRFVREALRGLVRPTLRE